MNKLKQQAQMLKAAFEEGYCADSSDRKAFVYMAWYNSTAKQMHDQLLMEAQSGLTVKS